MENGNRTEGVEAAENGASKARCGCGCVPEKGKINSEKQEAE